MFSKVLSLSCVGGTLDSGWGQIFSFYKEAAGAGGAGGALGPLTDTPHTEGRKCRHPGGQV